MRLKVAVILVLALVVSSLATAQDEELTLTVLSSYQTGIWDEGAAEIGAYNVEAQRLFVSNGATSTLDIFDLSDPSNITLITEVDLDAIGGTANSVDTFGDFAVVVIDGEEDGDNGFAVFMNLDGEELARVMVGVLPDMVKITPDGTKALVANEGEPSDDYTLDPEGGVSFIDLTVGVENLTDDNVNTVSFEGFSEDIINGARIFGPNASVAQDLEPEYIAITPDSAFALVTLQENNAIAGIDVAGEGIIAVNGLGYKDHSLPGNEFDASNEDGQINIQNWPTLGMYQPDAIAIYEANGTIYAVTANEGDAREYIFEDADGNEVVAYSEEARVADVTLDPDAFPNAEELQAEDQLGRLLMTTSQGDTDGDGDFDVLYSFGARSFTIWDVNTGEVVFDSGADFENITAELIPDAFNSQGLNESFDNRSDDKGPEPEGVVLGEVNGEWYAFIGLERVGGVMVYNISDPAGAYFVAYANNVNLDAEAESADTGDIAPEGLVFVSAEDSPNGTALLIITNEVSGSITVYGIE